MGITIKDIAKKCGVGVSTVSRALNNHPDINSETKEKVLKIVAEYDFVPNNSARNLKRLDSKSIAILVEGIDNPFFSTMLRVMDPLIRKRGYDFLIEHIGKNQDDIEVALEQIAEKKVRGIVFLGGDFQNKTDKLAKISVPFVAVSAILPDDLKSLGTCVTIDDKKESCKMVSYLCQKGYKKIAILASDNRDTTIGKARLDGYLQALKENHVKEDKQLIQHLKGKDVAYSMQNGYLLTRKLLEKDADFDALFAISDLMVIGAVKALLEAGKRIPVDVAVAGFDGLEYTKYFEPEITTMAQPTEDIAKESVEALFEMIDTKEKVPGKILAARLIKRKSTEGENEDGKQIDRNSEK